MGQSMRDVALETASVLLYVAGAVLVLVVAFRGYLAIEANSLGATVVVDLVLLATSGGLFVLGLRVSPGLIEELTLDPHTRVGRHEPDPSKLEQLGYRVPSEGAGESRPTTAYEDGTLYRVCPACEERNETDFDYCRRCSTKLER
jgi:ribosomal protein L40E